MVSMYTHAVDVADAMDTRADAKADAMVMKMATAAVETVTADAAATNRFLKHEDCCCHIELEYGRPS